MLAVCVCAAFCILEKTLLHDNVKCLTHKPISIPCHKRRETFFCQSIRYQISLQLFHLIIGVTLMQALFKHQIYCGECQFLVGSCSPLLLDLHNSTSSISKDKFPPSCSQIWFLWNVPTLLKTSIFHGEEWWKFVVECSEKGFQVSH